MKKERHYNVPSQIEMLPTRGAPKGMRQALKKAIDKMDIKLAGKWTRRRNYIFMAAEERRIERKRNLEKWIENANNSIIETPENKRRNLIKTAWKNVIRKENNEKTSNP
ncbi:hypothetical protein UFOVP742_21 [uncultured Caudovirales phage]|uniref:Uncharacterized protein n=1 Tax=uncultured Caudovirales phage TaxID=2100421 RepID=A0A6J7X7Z8_9CAUD|nr:hypothetical protein UFOVP742_21 [uncultured Caudovirales phage]